MFSDSVIYTRYHTLHMCNKFSSVWVYFHHRKLFKRHTSFHMLHISSSMSVSTCFTRNINLIEKFIRCRHTCKSNSKQLHMYTYTILAIYVGEEWKWLRVDRERVDCGLFVHYDIMFTRAASTLCKYDNFNYCLLIRVLSLTIPALLLSYWENLRIIF